MIPPSFQTVCLVRPQPPRPQAEFAVRALDTATTEDAYRKVVNCAKAGELATGAKLEFKEPRVALKAPIAVPQFVELVADKLRSLGVPDREMKTKTDFASSDLGNVGHAFPTVNLTFKIAPEGTAGHSDAFRDAAATEEAWKGTVVAAKAVALSAYDLLTHPDKVKEIQNQFKELKAKEGK